MRLLDKLERKIGKYAIKNLMLFVIILYIIGFVIKLVAPQFYYSVLILNPAAIVHLGQWWRIFTFFLSPPPTNLIFAIFTMYLYYMLGMTLERTWGAFKFNVYFFMGAILTIAATIVIYLATGYNMTADTYYVNMSLFLAFAVIYPDVELLLLFFIPIKIKWLAVIDVVLLGIRVVMGIATKDYASAIVIVVSIANFLIFMLMYGWRSGFNPRNMKRKVEYRAKAMDAETYRKNAYMHRCHICGRTSESDPELSFRYCSMCEGSFEYCQDHLFTHTHVKL